ncbi:hypothetical protein VTO42DRAFT_4565 [Malbranchea cinnamomea]
MPPQTSDGDSESRGRANLSLISSQLRGFGGLRPSGYESTTPPPTYDYKRALCEDPKVIREWFQLVQNTIEKYGILPEDIYNFDEVGFLMGIIATTRVVTDSEKNLRPNLIQPENRELATVIQGVNASGWYLPPMFIVKGKNHRLPGIRLRDCQIEV